ncbi:2042_t:CDS:2, partial [Paraglomus brasilianum]
PCAVKVARSVLRRGKPVRAYLFQPPDSANTSVDGRHKTRLYAGTPPIPLILTYSQLALLFETTQQPTSGVPFGDYGVPAKGPPALKYGTTILPKCRENKKYGRVRGEGSLCAAIKSQSASKFGIRVQPEPRILYFVLYIKNVQNTLGPFQDQTQEFRVTRKRQTYFQQLFEGKGRVQAKPGSDFVWEYVLTGKNSGEHLTQEGMIKIVKLAYSLNTEGKGKARKRTLDEVRTIIRENGKPPAADTTCPSKNAAAGATVANPQWPWLWLAGGCTPASQPPPPPTA